jgi:hypothetical protein
MPVKATASEGPIFEDFWFIRQKRAPTQVKVQSYPDGYPTRAYLVSWIARIFNLKNSGSRKP